jgi:hypothetical protein
LLSFGMYHYMCILVHILVEGPDELTALWTFVSLAWMPNHTAKVTSRQSPRVRQKAEEEKVPRGMRAMTSLHPFHLLGGWSARS